MASTQPHQQSPTAQQLVSTTSGKNRVMPTTSSTASSGATASGSGASGAATATGIVAGTSNPAAAAAAAAAALTMSVTPNSNQTNQDLASLFECPVCFDYVLPPILQVRMCLNS